MIKNIKEIVIASHNEGKVREIRSLLKPMGLKIYSAKKFCINEPIENGKTFKENSLIKSKNAAKKSGIPAIADDSGLCILSLGNQPGNDDKGWMLTSTGLKFSKNSKNLFSGLVIRKKRLTKVEKNYLLREEYRITNSEAYNKYINNKKAEITEIDLKKLFKIDDYTTSKDLEKRIVKLLDNFPEKHKVYQIINNYKKEVKQYVN